MNWDWSEWQGDRLSSDQCCLTEAEAEAAEQEQLERERLKTACARGLLRLGLVPRSFVNQRLWRGK